MIVLYLIGALGLGRLLVNVLPFAWHRVEAWALAVVFGYFFSAWMLLIACSLLGFSAGVAVVFALLLGCWLLPQTRRSPDRLSLATTRQTALWFVATGILSLGIVCLMYRQMLLPGPLGAYSIEDDLPIHLAIITNVAYGTHFTWHFSLMAGTYLTYPFLIDFLSGMIVRWGGSLRVSLLLVSVPLCLALVQLLFFLAYRLFRDARAAALFAAIFLLNGSNGGSIAALIDFFHSRSSLWAFLSNPPYDYSNNVFYRFGNFVTTILEPQRGFQFGLSIFCAVMLLVQQLNRDMEPLPRRRVLFFVGVLVGLLPLAHVHSFFISFVVLLTFALFDRGSADLREWLIAVLTSFAIALPQVAFQLFSNRHASFVHYQPGWMFTPSFFPKLSYDAGLSLFILANFGVILPLVALSIRPLRDYRMMRLFILLGSLIGLATFLFIFQPYIYDNIKFMVYAFFFFSLGIARYLAVLSRSRCGRWAWAPLALLLTACGGVSLIWKIRQHPVLYDSAALRDAREFRRQLPPDSLVLSAAYAEHPLWGLAGRSVVDGDTAYLWSYGLMSGRVASDVREIYAGGADSLALLRRYGVQYVLISRYERRYVSTLNEPFFNHRFPVIYQSGGTSIYQVRRASS